MFNQFRLAIVFGALLFAISEIFSGSAVAAVSNLATNSGNIRVDAPSNAVPLINVRGGRRGGGGGRAGNVRRSGGGNVNRNVNRNKNVNRNVNRNKNVNRNVNVNRNINVNVRHRGYGWRGARWGAIAFGVTMGTIIVVAANTPPYAPDPSLCWTWENSALTRGYWYYCSGP